MRKKQTVRNKIKIKIIERKVMKRRRNQGRERVKTLPKKSEKRMK